jgi:transposase-like protein
VEIIKITQRFDNEAKCYHYLEKIRWNNCPICPYCQSDKASKRKNDFRYKCLRCNRSFSVLVGTILEGTKLPIIKWLIAVGLILNAKKGISSLQLSRDLGINKNSAWYLQKRIRWAMGEEETFLHGLIEADESYIGGSLVNKHEKLKKERGYHTNGMEHKTPVLGMVERNGKIIVKVLEKAWGKEIKPIMKNLITKESEIVTDGFGGYKDLGLHFDKHVILYHSKKVRRIKDYHTNTIEGFWSMFKRAIVGQYHKITSKHLQEYINEMVFKYNYRNNKRTYNILINNCLMHSNAFS